MLERLQIDTRPGTAPAVAGRLGWARDLRFAGSDGDHRIDAVWKAGDGRKLEALSEALRALDPDIVEVSSDPVR
jgi:hypothetical protein